jgi:hypothetical protein
MDRPPGLGDCLRDEQRQYRCLWRREHKKPVFAPNSRLAELAVAENGLPASSVRPAGRSTVQATASLAWFNCLIKRDLLRAALFL